MASTLHLLLALVGSSVVCLLASLSSAAPAGLRQAEGGSISAGPPATLGQLERVRRESADKKKEKEKGRAKDRKAARECLAAHNKYRKKHGVPELKWDDKIAEFAQKRSDHIAKSDGAEFGHPPDLPFGENLFWHSSSDTACEHMVKGWYDEINLYNFKAPLFEAATGHFTQLIWSSSERVGCALAHSSGKRGGVYLTCNYDPPGNYLGEFEANVPLEIGAFPNAPRAVTGATSTTERPTTALATSTSSTTTSTTSAAPTTKPKKKGKKKDKKKKKKVESEKEKEEKKKEMKKKKGNKKKKNKKKKTSTSTTTTTTTLKPSTP